MFENLTQRYQTAKEKRRKLRNAKRQLEGAITTVKQLARAYDEDITRIRKELDQEAHAATTRKSLEQAWYKAIDNREHAPKALISSLNDLHKAYKAFQEQGGPERYDVEDMLDFDQYAYTENTHGLITKITRIGQIVVDMVNANID